MPKYNDFDLDVQISNISNTTFVFSNKTCTEITNKTCPPVTYTSFKC